MVGLRGVLTQRRAEVREARSRASGCNQYTVTTVMTVKRGPRAGHISLACAPRQVLGFLPAGMQHVSLELRMVEPAAAVEIGMRPAVLNAWLFGIPAIPANHA